MSQGCPYLALTLVVWKMCKSWKKSIIYFIENISTAASRLHNWLNLC